MRLHGRKWRSDDGDESRNRAVGVRDDGLYCTTATAADTY